MTIWTSPSHSQQSSEWVTGSLQWFSPRRQDKGESDKGVYKSEDAESPSRDALHLPNGVARDALSFPNDYCKLLSDGQALLYGDVRALFLEKSLYVNHPQDSSAPSELLDQPLLS